MLNSVALLASYVPALRAADARNVLAQLERDLGTSDAAVQSATEAYKLAWCDGPPYAYHYGLSNAHRHLRERGASVPPCPEFDASKFPPIKDLDFHMSGENKISFAK